jgi:SNF2 family DNA or RNA helicase
MTLKMDFFEKELDKRMEYFQKYLNYSGLEPKDYQFEGVRWCIRNEIKGLKDDSLALELGNYRGGGFIADEMGLGKTILMIGTFLSHFLPKTLIVVPLVLLDQWYQQIYKTTCHKAIIYHGQKRWDYNFDELFKSKGCLIVITTYDMIITENSKKNKNKKNLNPLNSRKLEKNNGKKRESVIHETFWDRIVFDEGHHLRNKKTLKYFGALSLKANVRWIVSGTPIQNKKTDFYHLCAIIGLPSSFYTNKINLPILVHDFILKRTKKQIGMNIADLSNNVDFVDWKNKEEMILSKNIHSYLSFSNTFLNKSLARQSLARQSLGQSSMLFSGLNPLVLLMRARQCCILPKLVFPSSELDKNKKSLEVEVLGSSKMDSVLKKLVERKDNGNGKLVFCHFKDEMDELSKRLCDSGIDKESIQIFDGRLRLNKRKEILNSGKFLVLILQIQTGCEGLNLQEHYSEIYFVSPHWNPAVEDQAVARCHRIGQKKQVEVFRFQMASFTKDLDLVLEEEQEFSLSLDNYASSVQEKKRLENIF